MAAPQQDLHGIDDADAADEERQETNDAQEETDLVDLGLSLSQQVVGRDDARRGKLLAQLAFDQVDISGGHSHIDHAVLRRFLCSIGTGDGIECGLGNDDLRSAKGAVFLKFCRDGDWNKAPIQSLDTVDTPDMRAKVGEDGRTHGDVVAADDALQREVVGWRREIGLADQGEIGRDRDEREGLFLSIGERNSSARIVGGGVISDAPLLLELIEEGQVALPQRRDFSIQPDIAAVSLDDIAQQGLVDAQPDELQSDNRHNAHSHAKHSQHRTLPPTHQRARGIRPVKTQLHKSLFDHPCVNNIAISGLSYHS